MSWSSSIIKALPFRLVLGLVAITGLGELLLLSVVDFFFCVGGDIIDCLIVFGWGLFYF